jgi:hypothetical protein
MQVTHCVEPGSADFPGGQSVLTDFTQKCPCVQLEHAASDSFAMNFPSTQNPSQFPSVSVRSLEPHEQLKTVEAPTAEEGTVVVVSDVKLTL